MNRNRALAVGLFLTAITAFLLVYAAKHVAYLMSFDQASHPMAGEAKPQLAVEKPYRTVTLSWDKVANARTYNLYWSKRPGVTRHTGNKIAGVSPPYRFARVEKGRTYYFVVTSVPEAGESSESEELVYRAVP